MVDRFKLIEEYAAPRAPRGGDVTKEAIERRWIVPFADGQFVYRAPWTATLRRLQELLRQGAIEHLGFEEWLFPRLVPAQAIESFELSHYVPEMLFRVEGHALALDPVQCISLYHLLSRNPSVLSAQEPLKIVECLGGWTWRNEDVQKLDGTIRTIEFARVEHVWLGSEREAREVRQTVLASVLGLFRKLGLSYRVVVGEGCMQIPQLEEARATAVTVEEIPVLDIELPLFRPEVCDGNPFGEIAGCTVEGTHLTSRFGITRAHGAPVHSGCCGVGLNRLVTAFLFQHGFDTHTWPAYIGTADVYLDEEGPA